MKFVCKIFSFLQCFFFSLFLYAENATHNDTLITEIFSLNDSKLNSFKATYPNLVFAFGLTLQGEYRGLQPQITQKDNMMQIIFSNLNILKTQTIRIQNHTFTLSKAKDSQVILSTQTQQKYSIITQHQKDKLFILFLPDTESTPQDSNNLSTQKQTLNNTSQDVALQNLQNFNAEYEIGSWRYFLVIGIMLLILLALYIVRLRQNKGRQVSNIIFEHAKILDSKNKIVVVKYNKTHYLLGLNPNGITLLDKIAIDKKKNIENQNEATEDSTIQTQQDTRDSQNFIATKQHDEKESLITNKAHKDTSTPNHSHLQTNFKDLLYQEK